MKKETEVVVSGGNPAGYAGTVGTPLYQSSTILFPTLEDYHNAERGEKFYPEQENGHALDYSYGINGTPTTFALQDTLCRLEGGSSCVITPSGLSAITTALLAFLQSGDHLLMIDGAYGPTRRFCFKELRKLGIETDYYSPEIGADIESLIKENTRVIFLESPCSQTFEIQDVPAITAIAKERNIITILDNSWATPLYFRPLEYGVDISIQACTKYIGGHSDIMLGAIICNEHTTEPVLRCYRNYGITASPHDCWLALRGIKSMAARLEYQQTSTARIVEWLAGRSEVAEILYPSYEKSPYHGLWKQLYSGAASLFSIVLDKDYPRESVANMVDNLELFGIGASWGGYESLILDFNPRHARTATSWDKDATCLRLYIGLENTEDLIADLDGGFSRLS